MASWRTTLALSFAMVAAGAQVANLSGTWQLNVQRSNWGKHPKPTSGTVVIEHQEPKFKYSGAVNVQTGTETSPGKSTFSYDGAIDGKEYPVTGTAGAGKMTIRRVNPTTIESELRSSDGALLETAKTTISADGKRLTRDIKGAGPGGEVSWTETYDRQ
jgi:hypothetical protein